MSTQLRRMATLIAAGLFMLLALAACGPKNIKVTAGTAEQTYTMLLDRNTAKAGDVTFDVTNQAASETHEFVIVQTDLAADSLPLDADGNVPEDQITVVDEVEDIAPGESKSLTVNLPAGHYALICNLPDHYRQGMHADFTVNP